MPKLKTNRAARKRLRKTGTGKIKRFKSLAGHFLAKKTSKRKRNLRKSTLITRADQKNVKKLVPYL
ncbi:MAG: 50S ribosomal protein L35 [candidate division Zixibacteria bacterium]|jgi:large subunit ribosomal protein L35|nr:50S ribosomal protein L35 [candidate division Zixibacteria bacterium]